MVKSLKEIKIFLVEVLSLSNPKKRISTFISVLILLGMLPTRYLENLPNLSICKMLFGKYCFSVGITRGVSALLKGDIALAIDYNWLSIPTLLIILWLIGFDIYKMIK
jgi:hypothetical protein